ncbi:hypothetical protein [Yersinia kristensenii]|uniref:Uncharacterized protein n=1 Tax=Yersinia kristensenii TaxID=28152 RepID=A0AB73NZI2_YERKR|nr:hypothetical protein [Yersinia kristensenii]OVZ82181.1 hypothetical protein CBW52_05055 [Yersinia kristensenii]
MSKTLAFAHGASGNISRSQIKRRKIQVTSVRRSRSVDLMVPVAVGSVVKLKLMAMPEFPAFRRSKACKLSMFTKSNEIPRVMGISIAEAQELSFRMLNSLESRIQDEMFDECE